MIWLIGNKGTLGSEVADLLSERGLPFFGTDREPDITDAAAIRAFAVGKDIDWIVNCAAYTAVDQAEDEQDLCRRLNSHGPANLGALASGIGASVIHISTDYVFDGSGNRPYTEDDPISPLGVYGKTKAEGEVALRDSCARSYILRTAWLYGMRGKSFVSTMLRLMREKTEIGVVADRQGTPTYARDLAQAILKIMDSGRIAYGAYHYTNAGRTTWYEFARAIHDEARRRGLLERDCEIRPLTADRYPTRARRPSYSVLSTAKIERVFGIVPPPWRQSLVEFIDSGGEQHRFRDCKSNRREVNK